MKEQENSHDPVDFFDQAIAKEQEGFLSDAEALYIAALNAGYTKRALLIFKLGRVNEKQEKYDFAQQYYTYLLREFEPRFTWFLRLAECKRKQGLSIEAIELFLKALALDGKNSNVLLRLSQLYLSEKHIDCALEYAERLVKIECSSANLAHYANVLYRYGCFQKASLIYKQAIDMAGSSVKAVWFVRQAECYKKIFDTDSAIVSYCSALKISPNNAAWHALLAMLYTKKDKTKLAIQSYQQATLLDNSNENWFAELGRLLADSDKDAAIAAYKNAVNLGRKSLSYEIAVLSSNGQNLQRLAPEVLFTKKRFDLCVKLLYARCLLGLSSRNSVIDSAELYLRHIHLRTKGKEPDNLTKISLADYQQGFIKLLKSIQQHGFDKAHAIPLAQDGCLLNGAHRSAASVALQCSKIPVLFVDNSQGICWDYDWFKLRGFSLDELNELLLCWLENTPERGHVVILWPAVVEHWDSITEDIANDLELVTHREIDFTKVGFSELIKDVYSTSKVADFMPNITAKLDRLAAYQPKIRVLVVYGDSLRVKAVKEKVRQQYHDIIPEHFFCTLHASADYEEAMHLGHIFFHQATLELLRNRVRPLSENICCWIAEAKQALLNRDESVLDGCVVGGAVLDAYGIRKADDLDITVSLAVRQEYFSEKASPLTDNVDIVNKDYARSVLGVISDDDLLTDRALHVYVRGFKFANLDVVRKRKSFSQREKDMADLLKISQYYLTPIHN